MRKGGAGPIGERKQQEEEIREDHYIRDSYFFSGVSKKTIDISNQKSLKVFRQRRSPGPPWTPEKKLRKVTSPGPRPLLDEEFQEEGVKDDPSSA